MTVPHWIGSYFPNVGTYFDAEVRTHVRLRKPCASP